MSEPKRSSNVDVPEKSSLRRPLKRLKTEHGKALVDVAHPHKMDKSALSGESDGQNLHQPILSNKERRGLRKAQKRKLKCLPESEDGFPSSASKQLAHEERVRKKKEARVEFVMERRFEQTNQLKQERKIRRQQTKLRKEGNNTKGEANFNEPHRIQTEPSKQLTTQGQSQDKKAGAAVSLSGDDRDMLIFRNLMNGSTDPATGMTNLRLGVQYKDIVVGSGPMVQDNMAVTVKYRLTGGKFGILLDSSNKFTFRLGKGEVIQGWNIGLQGMRVGGRRKLIVPPKAGYGAQDIGAGAGALLHFEVWLLSC